MQLSHRSILLAYIYFAVFSRRGYCRLAAIVFAAWVAVPFFASLRHFYSSRHFLPCHFHRCHPFYRCSASNIAAFHSRLDLELPFLLWSAILILLLKMFSLRLQVAALLFFCCFSGCRSSRHFHAVMLFLLSLFNQ